MRDLKADKEDSTTISFKQGIYNKETGVANYTVKQLPRAIENLLSCTKRIPKTHYST
jgi:hypothetical protein